MGKKRKKVTISPSDERPKIRVKPMQKGTMVYEPKTAYRRTPKNRNWWEDEMDQEDIEEDDNDKIDGGFDRREL